MTISCNTPAISGRLLHATIKLYHDDTFSCNTEAISGRLSHVTIKLFQEDYCMQHSKYIGMTMRDSNYFRTTLACNTQTISGRLYHNNHPSL